MGADSKRPGVGERRAESGVHVWDRSRSLTDTRSGGLQLFVNLVSGCGTGQQASGRAEPETVATRGA